MRKTKRKTNKKRGVLVHLFYLYGGLDIYFVSISLVVVSANIAFLFNANLRIRGN